MQRPKMHHLWVTASFHPPVTLTPASFKHKFILQIFISLVCYGDEIYVAILFCIPTTSNKRKGLFPPTKHCPIIEEEPVHIQRHSLSAQKRNKNILTIKQEYDKEVVTGTFATKHYKNILSSSHQLPLPHAWIESYQVTRLASNSRSSCLCLPSTQLGLQVGTSISSLVASLKKHRSHFRGIASIR